jgi:outer membrane protein assembly factor BamB
MLRVALMFAAFVAAPMISHAQGSDWPGFLGPLGTSVSTEKGIIAPWPKDGLRVVWHKEVGTGYCMPAISNGKLFHFDRVAKNARLSCLDPKTGDEHWTFKYPTAYKDKYGYNNGPRCSPVVDGDLVFLHGAEGMLHCLNAKDGSVVWKVDTAAKFGVIQNFFGAGGTPLVEGDLLIVPIGGSPPNSDPDDFTRLKGNGTGVVAFHKATGKIAYQISDELASYASPVIATIRGRRWCFVFARGGLLAFNPADGKIDFHFPYRAPDLESVNASNPVVVGDKVFITETYGPGGALLQVKPGGYDVLWSDAKKAKKSMMCHWMTPIHVDGYLYGSSNRHDFNAELRCIELATGKIMWSERDLSRASLLQIDGHFICLGEEGTVRLLKINPKEYQEVSACQPRDPKTKEKLLAEPCWAAPIVSHGLLYLRGDGRLVCLELIPAKN